MVYECNQCDIKFLFHFQLIVHRNVHYVNTEIKNNVFMCQLCHKKCLNLDHLKTHIIQHVEATTFTCGICSKQFVCEKKYVDHMKYHLGLFKCSLCDKNFTCKRNLMEHVQLHTREATFDCEICQKAFVRVNQLTVHSKKHILIDKGKNNKKNQSIKAFQCNFCEKKFSKKSNLTFHALSHTNPLSKVACECCGQSFLRLDHLQRHKRLHSCDYKNKQCRCIICSIWIDKDSLKTHMKELHLGEKPFHCNCCDNSFQRKTQLIFHQRSHKM